MSILLRQEIFHSSHSESAITLCSQSETKEHTFSKGRLAQFCWFWWPCQELKLRKQRTEQFRKEIYIYTNTHTNRKAKQNTPLLQRDSEIILTSYNIFLLLSCSNFLKTETIQSVMRFYTVTL